MVKDCSPISYYRDIISYYLWLSFSEEELETKERPQNCARKKEQKRGLIMVKSKY